MESYKILLFLRIEAAGKETCAPGSKKRCTKTPEGGEPMKKETKIGEWLKEGFEAVKSDIIGYALPALAIGLICITVIGALLVGPLLCGFYHIVFQRMQGKRPSTGDLFKGFDVFLDAFIASVVLFLAIFIVSLIPVLGFLLSLLVGAAFIFVFPLIWEKRFSAAKAIQESFHLFKENWLHLTLFYIVGSIVGGIGVLLFGIGIILTFPVYFYATACLYRDWVGFDKTTSTPELTAEPFEPK